MRASSSGCCDPSMLLEGALEHEQSRRGIAARGEQERPASRRGRERPRTPGRPRLVLELPQQLGGGVKVSHADLRLDRVGVYRDDARLPDPHLAQERTTGSRCSRASAKCPRESSRNPSTARLQFAYRRSPRCDHASPCVAYARADAHVSAERVDECLGIEVERVQLLEARPELDLAGKLRRAARRARTDRRGIRSRRGTRGARSRACRARAPQGDRAPPRASTVPRRARPAHMDRSPIVTRGVV